MMASTVVLHFSPIELYPPVMNLLNQAVVTNTGKKWIVITTASDTCMEPFQSSSPRMKVLRFGKSGRSLGRLSRAISYLRYYSGAFFMLLYLRPFAILYYETLSSFPVFLCRPFIKKSRIFIHYHEYISPIEHGRASKWFKWLRRRERNVLPFAFRISHTNPERLNMFLRDERLCGFNGGRVMPNYPPSAWAVNSGSKMLNFPLRVVYAGALSFDSMYIKEFSAWVMEQKGMVIWDIYSWQPEASAFSYLKDLQCDWIRIKNPVAYRELPELLRTYDVGVILYKGHIPNFIWNVPNKLFEYHLNGLDVWFPSVMKGCEALVTKTCYPKILAFDFEQMDRFDLREAMARDGLEFSVMKRFCEDAFSELLEELN